MYTRFIISNGRYVYAPLTGERERIKLKQELDSGAVTMYCGCSNEDSRLFYSISKDLRFVPLHKHYVHKPWCSRFNACKRTTAAVYDEDGQVRVYTSFAVNSFSLPAKPKEEAELTEAELRIKRLREEERLREKERKEELGLKVDGEDVKESLPSFNLSELVKFLNHDAYMLRLVDGKYPYLSEDYFLASVQGYLKKVTLDGMKKPLKELTLDKDKIQFFYNKVIGLSEKGFQYQGYENRIGSRYVPEGILAKAEEAFEKTYGISVFDYMHTGSVYAAGFIYERLSRKNTTYRCVGRILLFPVTENGLFVDSLLEKDIVEALMCVCKRNKYQFEYPEDESGNIIGVVRNPDTLKEAPVFLNIKRKGFHGVHLALHGKVPTEDEIEEFFKLL